MFTCVVNGNPIAADASFLEKRRKGLARFTNALVRHPVLVQEQLVVMFLTVPTVRITKPPHIQYPTPRNPIVLYLKLIFLT